ncbi:MAG: DUF763 domain-containing protein [Treponema sp.]|nr:DUF763 domain-containing protein [Candidatus Treponema caballi]
MRSTGHADLPLHTGTVPKWLADRMRDMGTLIVESLIMNYGRKEVLVRLSDPLWFQSLGAVLGMDWHSSGITTSVMYALKRGLNARAKELGIVVCGGRGKYSRRTPDELMFLSDATGLNGDELVRASKLTAKVDNTAVQDGFQLYQHNFILTCEGDWTVVQQGMNPLLKTARRYHWCSEGLRSFIEEPHAGVVGENRGEILNLTASAADKTRGSILEIAHEEPSRIIKECGKMSGQLELFTAEDGTMLSKAEAARSVVMPSHHEVRREDVDLKRLGAVLATAYETPPASFENLLLTPGLGPRTLQSLTLVSEVIYGTPSRFTDPARFSFAHGGKDGHPFPVPLNVYDESIRVLHDSIERSKLGYNDKSECLRRLHGMALNIEKNCAPEADFDAAIAWEKQHSQEWGGRTVGGCK